MTKNLGRTPFIHFPSGLWRIAEDPGGMISARFASDANGRAGYGISRGCYRTGSPSLATLPQDLLSLSDWLSLCEDS